MPGTVLAARSASEVDTLAAPQPLASCLLQLLLWSAVPSSTDSVSCWKLEMPVTFLLWTSFS